MRSCVNIDIKDMNWYTIHFYIWYTVVLSIRIKRLVSFSQKSMQCTVNIFFCLFSVIDLWLIDSIFCFVNIFGAFRYFLYALHLSSVQAFFSFISSILHLFAHTMSIRSLTYPQPHLCLLNIESKLFTRLHTRYPCAIL